MKTSLKHNLLSAALAVGGLLAAHAASAALVLAPSFTNTTAGNSYSVDVRVTDLGSNQVGSFDIDVAYNAALLTPTGVTFGPFLGDPNLFEALTDFSFATAGVVDFGESSFLTPAELDALQSESFLLATLSFDAIGTGVASFAVLSTSTLGDASGNPLAIPEPGSLLLLGLGFAGLIASRRKNGGSARVSFA